MSEIKNIPIAKIETNKGQIEGLPKNPRFIKDYRFEQLKKSIEQAPEMLALRELIVYPFNGKFIAVCGNMRLKACQELGYKELPCKVLDESTPVEKLREYAIKDNVGFGDDDMDILANEWDTLELEEWGYELPVDFEGDEAAVGESLTDQLKNAEYVEKENYFVKKPFVVIFYDDEQKIGLEKILGIKIENDTYEYEQLRKGNIDLLPEQK